MKQQQSSESPRIRAMRSQAAEDRAFLDQATARLDEAEADAKAKRATLMSIDVARQGTISNRPNEARIAAHGAMQTAEYGRDALRAEITERTRRLHRLEVSLSAPDDKRAAIAEIVRVRQERSAVAAQKAHRLAAADELDAGAPARLAAIEEARARYDDVAVAARIGGQPIPMPEHPRLELDHELATKGAARLRAKAADDEIAMQGLDEAIAAATRRLHVATVEIEELAWADVAESISHPAARILAARQLLGSVRRLSLEFPVPREAVAAATAQMRAEIEPPTLVQGDAAMARRGALTSEESPTRAARSG